MALKSKETLKNERVIDLLNGTRFLIENSLSQVRIFQKIAVAF